MNNNINTYVHTLRVFCNLYSTLLKVSCDHSNQVKLKAKITIVQMADDILILYECHSKLTVSIHSESFAICGAYRYRDKEDPNKRNMTRCQFLYHLCGNKQVEPCYFLAQAAIAKTYFSWFWKLKVQDQGASMFWYQ